MNEDCGEPYLIHLPDVSRLEMEFLLALLYCGTANIYRKELTNIVTLTRKEMSNKKNRLFGHDLCK